MKVISYLNSVPAKNSNKQKTELLENYAAGAKAFGDEGMVYAGTAPVDCDVAVIQGWVYKQVSTPHLRLRDQIIKKQLLDKKYVCVADANLFLYANKVNPFGYLRYSFNGIFPNTGIYCDTDIDPTRWQQISRDTGIKIENKKLGDNIVLCVQRSGGWSMGETDVIKWITKVVRGLRKFTNRKIIIRPHPGDKQANKYIRDPRLTLLKNQNVEISNPGTPLEIDLKNCYAVVNHNSSSIVGPIIQGYHAFITDPERSQCAEVSNHSFADIENPKEFDRQSWLERISMFHWKFSELKDGTCWAHMRNYCQ
jgi:hypothetical protein